MTLLFTFTLDSGAQLHTNPSSTIRMADGSTKSQEQVAEGDRVCHVVGESAVVMSISAEEV